MFKKILSLWYIILAAVVIWKCPIGSWPTWISYCVLSTAWIVGYRINPDDILGTAPLYRHTSWALFQLRAAFLPWLAFTILFIVMGAWPVALFGTLASFICHGFLSGPVRVILALPLQLIDQQH